MAADLAILLLLSIANGVFAMSEAAMIASRKARLQQRADEGDTGALAALKLASSPSRFLSTVQIGITLIAIISGAFGGSTLAEELAPIIERVPFLAPYREALSVAVVVLLITYLSLVIGELVPKRLALNDAEGIAAMTAPMMRRLSTVTGPVVSFLDLSSNTALRLMGVRPSDEPPVTQEEVKIMIEQGRQAGVFEEAEQDMVTNVLRLADWRVQAVMTPRTDMIWLDLDDLAETNLEKIREHRFSFYPVFQKDMTHLRGVVSIKDVWNEQVQGNALNLPSLLKQPLFVPASTPVLKVLEQVKTSGIHIVMVIDEQGDIEGLVTMTDLIRAILGELAEAGQPPEAEAVQREDGSWLLDGMLSCYEVEEILDEKIFPEDERNDYQTLGGFMMMRLGHIPSVADRFDWESMRFEVLDMDGRRVDKVLVSRLPPVIEEGEIP